VIDATAVLVMGLLFFIFDLGVCSMNQILLVGVIIMFSLRGYFLLFVGCYIDILKCAVFPFTVIGIGIARIPKFTCFRFMV
jgi:hypothetical protein